jgi:hypothetical protein
MLFDRNVAMALTANCVALCLLLLLPWHHRYQELAGQHKKILQHLNHRIEKITGVFDH